MSPSARRVALVVLAEFERGEDELEQLERATREAPFLEARQLSAWLLRKLYGASFPALGREFGDRDHTTMMASVRKIERNVRNETPLGQRALKLLEALTRPSGAREPTEIEFAACPPMTIELDLDNRPFEGARRARSW